jgi:hypothetical protein
MRAYHTRSWCWWRHCDRPIAACAAAPARSPARGAAPPDERGAEDNAHVVPMIQVSERDQEAIAQAMKACGMRTRGNRRRNTGPVPRRGVLAALQHVLCRATGNVCIAQTCVTVTQARLRLQCTQIFVPAAFYRKPCRTERMRAHTHTHRMRAVSDTTAACHCVSSNSNANRALSHAAGTKLAAASQRDPEVPMVELLGTLYNWMHRVGAEDKQLIRAFEAELQQVDVDVRAHEVYRVGRDRARRDSSSPSSGAPTSHPLMMWADA